MKKNTRKLNSMEQKDLSLPANYATSVEETLAKTGTPDFIVDKISKLLEATRLSAGGNPIPDYQAREGGLKLLLSCLIGLPIQRQEIRHTKFDSLEELQRRVQHSPALQEALASLRDSRRDKPLPDGG